MLPTHDDERARSCPQVKVHRRRGRASRARRLLLASLVTLAGGSAIAAPAMARPQSHPVRYAFQTLDNQADPTFNQLLGINQRGVIAGYFGAGTPGHPNKGYLLAGPHQPGQYLNENFPGSAQTQVTGLNNRGVTVGFWADANNDNFGFYARQGRFYEVNFPGSLNSGGTSVNQLLGVNDHDTAVGFYTDAAGNSHGYTYRIGSHHFTRVTVPGATSVTAAAINNRNDVGGFYTDAQGNVHGFLRTHGQVKMLDAPGASMTMVLGVNDQDEAVGVYQVGSGSDAVMHGFTWTRRTGFATVDDPNGTGTTTINGVNDRGQLVGFYVDSAGNTDGMLATPERH